MAAARRSLQMRRPLLCLTHRGGGGDTPALTPPHTRPSKPFLCTTYTAPVLQTLFPCTWLSPHAKLADPKHMARLTRADIWQIEVQQVPRGKPGAASRLRVALKSNYCLAHSHLCRCGVLQCLSLTPLLFRHFCHRVTFFQSCYGVTDGPALQKNHC